MASGRKGAPIHGWLVLDKPLGMTSTQAVAEVKRLYNARKAGHAGTLDPLATGILPIALGEATKTVSFAVDGEKAYLFTVRWGAETETDDAEGRVTATSDRRPSLADIKALLPQYTGEILQVPPSFSAIKVDGERAYDLAREGQPADLEPRRVEITHLDVVEQPDADSTTFEASCGRGTYVRALARDIGRALGTYGHVIRLRRTCVGPFHEACAVGLAELRELAESGERESLLGSKLLPVDAPLEGLQLLNVSAADALRLRRGQPVLLRGRDAPVATGIAYARSQGQLVAVGELEKGSLRPTRVFNFG
jgi:tRNA pseudouridine55 synthase